MRTWFPSTPILVLLFPVLLSAQDGGDQIGTFGGRYDRLNKASGKDPSFHSSKALGVYQASVPPEALLEVNSRDSHYDWVHPNLSSRGDLFRTSAPGNVTANWRFHQGGSELGRFWSEPQNGDFQLRAPKGDIRFWSSETDPAAFQMEMVRIWGADERGGVSINEDNAVNPMPRIALLNLGTYVGYGQRPWMENGIFAGVASDGLYLGMKSEDGDHHDAVLSWNDNADPQLKDHLRFLFTQIPNAGTDAAGPDGLEMGRFAPGKGDDRNRKGAAPDNSGLGLGNFYVPNGPDISVTNRLDVLDGDVRIRDLPQRKDPRTQLFVVVRPNGVLRVRELSGLMMTESSIDSLERQIREQEERIEYLMERIRSLEKGSRRIEKKSGSSSSKTRIKLGHPQPNPFREKTRISFQLSETTSVSLSIVDEGGEQIVQLLSEQKSSGYHELQWKGGDHEPGTYFCVLRANGDKRVKKLIKRK